MYGGCPAFRTGSGEAARTGTPWIGEHLAFISADGLGGDGASPTSLTYTVCPQLSEETVERVLALVRERLGRVPDDAAS